MSQNVCPWCGGKAIARGYLAEWFGCCLDAKCDAGGPTRPTEAEALAVFSSPPTNPVPTASRAERYAQLRRLISEWREETGEDVPEIEPVAVREPAAGTVRVRLAVAVEADGSWRCDSCSAADDNNNAKSARQWCSDLNDEQHVVWIEADLPLPAPAPVVRGRVVE